MYEVVQGYFFLATDQVGEWHKLRPCNMFLKSVLLSFPLHTQPAVYTASLCICTPHEGPQLKHHQLLVPSLCIPSTSSGSATL